MALMTGMLPLMWFQQIDARRQTVVFGQQTVVLGQQTVVLEWQ
jgi:hypothetical protein